MVWLSHMLTGLALAALFPSSGYAHFLRELEKYISYEQSEKGDVVSQKLDVMAMEHEGVKTQLIQFAQNIVACNNLLLYYSATSKNLDTAYLSQPCDSVRALINYGVLKSDDDTHRCGTISNPVPDYAAPWVSYSSARMDAYKKLARLGFHKTVGYACGASDPVESCSTDHTRPRGYESLFGSCPAPAFRDQAIVVAKYKYKIQVGEPNPELHTYVWPYFTWGAYVKWWHDTH